MPKTYQLYLATEITSPTSNSIVPINVSNTANVTWQVDFKSLFGNDIERFRRCTVRVHLLSQVYGLATNADPFIGYLSINLPTTQNASTAKGTPLMHIYPTLVSGTSFIYNCSTLGNVQGVDIPVPTSNQFLNVQFMNCDSFNPMASIPNYQLILQFELLDEVV